MAGQAHYAGSSMVRKTLAEMTSLGDQPTAILVETRPEVVIRVETILSKLGYATCVVQSVRELQRVIDRGGDIRLILSKIELSDLPPVEMVDLVRRTSRGKNLPILFYGPEDPALMWKRWDAPTVVTKMPSSAAGLYDVLDAVRRNRRLPSLTVIDRQHYRDTAEQKPAS
jgi:predicted aconitase with swiveling domain